MFIPRKYGIYMPVGDTTGPGGTARALRMVPAMVDIARDVLDLAPEALFINYGNPMAVVCRAVRKATGASVIGLCIGVPRGWSLPGGCAGSSAGRFSIHRRRHQPYDLVLRYAGARPECLTPRLLKWQPSVNRHPGIGYPAAGGGRSEHG